MEAGLSLTWAQTPEARFSREVAQIITLLLTSVSVDKETNKGVPNLCLWDVATGKCLKAFIQKKVTYW